MIWLYMSQLAIIFALVVLGVLLALRIDRWIESWIKNIGSKM